MPPSIWLPSWHAEQLNPLMKLYNYIRVGCWSSSAPCACPLLNWMETIAATIAKRMRMSALELFRNIAMVDAGDTFHEASPLQMWRGRIQWCRSRGKNGQWCVVTCGSCNLQQLMGEPATACHGWAPIWRNRTLRQGKIILIQQQMLSSQSPSYS